MTSHDLEHIIGRALVGIGLTGFVLLALVTAAIWAERTHIRNRNARRNR